GGLLRHFCLLGRNDFVSLCFLVEHDLSQSGTHPGSSGPIPKFVTTRSTLRCELRNLRTTSNSMISSAVLNLKFLNELAASYDRNFKFTALVTAMWGLMKFRNFLATLGRLARPSCIQIARGIAAMLLFAVVVSITESARAD